MRLVLRSHDFSMQALSRQEIFVLHEARRASSRQSLTRSEFDTIQPRMFPHCEWIEVPFRSAFLQGQTSGGVFPKFNHILRGPWVHTYPAQNRGVGSMASLRR